MSIQEFAISTDRHNLRRDNRVTKNEIEAMFAQASALFASKQYQKATSVYVAAVPLSSARGVPARTMEAWLMQAYCQEIMGNIGWAFAFARVALHHAEKVPFRKRSDSTIANIGEALIRYVQAIRKTGTFTGIPTETDINERMVLLLGEDWHDRSISLEQLLGTGTSRFGSDPGPQFLKGLVGQTVSDRQVNALSQMQMKSKGV